VATIADRVSRLWRRRSSGTAIEPPVADAAVDRRFEALEARIEHLETALEGLQDALYRHEILDKESIAELHRRTDPEQLARDLSQDARRRGL
jgi:uncharacterized coiled-coil protein SlyX